MTQCKYIYEGKYRPHPCSEEVWTHCAKGFCLYHSPDNGKNKETARKVWDEARKRGQNPDGCDFTGWCFPPDPEAKWFTQNVFSGPAIFRGARFEYGVDFLLAVFSKNADFTDVFFGKDKRFPLKDPPDVDVRDIPSSGLHPYPHGRRDAEFSSAEFRDRADFSYSVFDRGSKFAKTVFSAQANFRNVNFVGCCDFTDTDFQGYADFWSASLPESTAIFRGTNFRGPAYFVATHFRGGVLLFDAVFHDKAWFHQAGLHDSAMIFAIPSAQESLTSCPALFHRVEEGETLYRLAKEAARRRGSNSMAGTYYFAEQCAVHRRKRREYGWRIWGWLPRWLLGYALFGYGERVLRPLFAGLLVIVIWAILYSTTDGVTAAGLPGETAAQNGIGFGECLYFSLVTFTTLGYGDMAPNAHLFFRFLAGAEAWLGAALMALFIVALSRKYMR